MSDQNFAFLDLLNREQLISVKESGLPLLINAGAGSGKTRVIASKIAFLINSGVNPENILALTFTEKAADEMRIRVKELLGKTHELQISTFHAFCNQFISDNLLETSLNSNFKTISDIAQLVFFVRNFGKFNLEYLQGTGLSAIAQEVAKFISRCKDESISLYDLQSYLEREQNVQLIDTSEQENILKDICKMFSAYEQYKEAQNMIDFGDMLLTVHNILSTKNRILKRYQNKYQYVIVDEFQDTNFIQLRILHLIAMKHRNICIVGDDDQSIYRFRGAYVTNIKEFKTIFPDYKEITLHENYRSNGNILEIANRVISSNPERQDKQLRTSNLMGDKVRVIECNSDITQTAVIVQEIEEIIGQKRPLREIAVLCRSKSSGIPIANELKKRQIPLEFIGKPDYFYKPIIKDLICLLKTVENPVFSNVEMVRTLEREVFCLKKTDVSKLTNLAHAKMCGIYEAFDFIDEIDIDKAKFLKIKTDIDNLIDHKNKLNVKELVYQILFNNDFYKYELQFNNIENISYLDMFYKFVEGYTYLYPQGELTDFISYVDLASEFGLEEERGDQESIKIMTVHSAKGKEFDNVFILDAIERKFPSPYRDDKFEIPQSLLKGTRSSYTELDLHIQEERRLFYVAITRAKNRLTILYAKRHHSNTTDSQPSRFLMDINYKNNPNIEFQIIKKENVLESEPYNNDQQFKITKEIIADIRSDNFIEAIRKVLLIANIRSADIHEIINNISEPDYVKLQEYVNNNLGHSQSVNRELEFSASQFNTYERCPRIYQYRYIYKIPGKPKPYFDFGSTVHMVIEELTNRIRDGQIVDKQIASEILKRMWNPKGFESKLEEEKSLQEISVILEYFLEETRAIGKQILDLEKKFVINIDDYLVNGVIDRIDSDGNDYVIIDYKTSRESFGPKKASEDIQLVLYSLAVLKLYGRMPKLVGWWFLRQNKKIMVQISTENIEMLIKKMSKIVESIRNSDFHPEPGWICKNCDYRLVCNDAKY